MRHPSRRANRKRRSARAPETGLDGGQHGGQHGEIKLGKRGVYLVAGSRKLKQFELISWDQILTMAGYSVLPE
ncbi:MAG TPA: hypothetical protein VGL97_09990 [Bryobacteraceae bacterium]|jgi:hypothetical protein